MQWTWRFGPLLNGAGVERPNTSHAGFTRWENRGGKIEGQDNHSLPKRLGGGIHPPSASHSIPKPHSESSANLSLPATPNPRNSSTVLSTYSKRKNPVRTKTRPTLDRRLSQSMAHAGRGEVYTAEEAARMLDQRIADRVARKASCVLENALGGPTRFALLRLKRRQ